MYLNVGMAGKVAQAGSQIAQAGPAVVVVGLPGAGPAGSIFVAELIATQNRVQIARKSFIMALYSRLPVCQLVGQSTAKFNPQEYKKE